MFFSCLMSEKISQKWKALAFGSSYFHQTFIECVPNQYTHFNVSTYQMWLQIVERLLIQYAIKILGTLGIFIYYYWPFMFELLYLHQTCTNCVSNQYTYWYVDMTNVTASYGMPLILYDVVVFHPWGTLVLWLSGQWS